jgi:hypothetical protein
MSDPHASQMSFKEFLQAETVKAATGTRNQPLGHIDQFFSSPDPSFHNHHFDIHFRLKPQPTPESFYSHKMRELKAERAARQKKERETLSQADREAFEVFEVHGCTILELSNLKGRLKREYRELAKHIHPDRFLDLKEKDLAHHEFIKLQLAYHTLLKLIPN